MRHRRNSRPPRNRNRNDPMSILYIEDTENNQILVRRRLQRAGYTVDIVETGEEGLTRARTDPPELILLDMGLPDIDGWEVVRRIREDSQLKDLPVIAITAHAMSGDRERCLEAGCDEYETKPFDFPSLLEKVAAFLDPTRA